MQIPKWVSAFFCFMMHLYQGVTDQQSDPLPTERSEGGRERWERRRWREERPERVAAVDSRGRCAVTDDAVGHRNSKMYRFVQFTRGAPRSGSSVKPHSGHRKPKTDCFYIGTMRMEGLLSKWYLTMFFLRVMMET